MIKIETVILDWAGTTVDYDSFAPVQAFVEAFQQFGVTPTIAEVREPMGMLKWNHIHTMMQMPRIRSEWIRIHGHDWVQEDVDAVYAASETSIMGILQNYASPKPYVLTTVATLRERGLKIGSTTGYTDAMMGIVVPEAERQGYAPDAWFTPNATGDHGRPFPYMIFRNLETLGVSSVNAAIKVGDTALDILEGKNAGVLSVGVIEGSSIMALSKEEYEALSAGAKKHACDRVAKVYQNSGADYVIQNISELPELISKIEKDLN